MCTFDYTPYTGCKDGQQHFYLQWMKCNTAVANNNTYCPLEKSIQVEELRRLSGNVLCCPIHKPIAVQQHEFLFVSHADTSLLPVPVLDRTCHLQQRTLASWNRASETFKGRTETQELEGPPGLESRKKKAPRNASPSATSPDSQPSSPLIERPKIAAEMERGDQHEWTGIGQDSKLDRRGSSADMDKIPIMTTSHSKKGLCCTSREASEQEDEDCTEKKARCNKLLRTSSAADLSLESLGIGIGIGLPSSPDMHRRSGMMVRSKSEATLTKGPTDECFTQEPLPTSNHITKAPIPSHTGSQSPKHNSDHTPSLSPSIGTTLSGVSSRNTNTDKTMLRIKGHSQSAGDEDDAEVETHHPSSNPRQERTGIRFQRDTSSPSHSSTAQPCCIGKTTTSDHRHIPQTQPQPQLQTRRKSTAQNLRLSLDTLPAPEYKRIQAYIRELSPEPTPSRSTLEQGRNYTSASSSSSSARQKAIHHTKLSAGLHTTTTLFEGEEEAEAEEKLRVAIAKFQKLHCYEPVAVGRSKSSDSNDSGYRSGNHGRSHSRGPVSRSKTGKANNGLQRANTTGGREGTTRATPGIGGGFTDVGQFGGRDSVDSDGRSASPGGNDRVSLRHRMGLRKKMSRFLLMKDHREMGQVTAEIKS